jgi:hypothetical protein
MDRVLTVRAVDVHTSAFASQRLSRGIKRVDYAVARAEAPEESSGVKSLIAAKFPGGVVRPACNCPAPDNLLADSNIAYHRGPLVFNV